MSSSTLIGQQQQFTDVQKAFFPITTLVPLVVAAAAWRLVRRGGGTKTFEQRLAPLSTLTSGILFGQFLFHVLPRVTLSVGDQYSLNTLFVLMGFLPMVWVFRLWRYCQINPYHEFSDEQAAVDVIMLPDNRRSADYQVQQATEVQEIEPLKFTSLQVRSRLRALSIVVYVVIFFQSFTDGIWVVFNRQAHKEAILLGVFWVDKLTESIVVTTMLHQGAFGPGVYWGLTTAFAVSVGLSTIFPLIPFWDVNAVIHHGVFQVFLGISGGVLLWLATQLIFQDPMKRTESGQTIGLLFLFTFAMAVMWATGYFL